MYIIYIISFYIYIYIFLMLMWIKDKLKEDVISRYGSETG